MKGLKWNMQYNGIGSCYVDVKIPFAKKIDRLFEPGINSAIYPFGRKKKGSEYLPINTFFMRSLGGAAQPLADFLKDIPDTFKGYKSSHHVKRDALQPIRGIGNIVKGALAPVGLIFLFLGFFLFVAPIGAIKSRKIKTLFQTWSLAVMSITLLALPALIESAASIFRGVTQLITTPLTWFLRMPLRGILTASGYKPIEENNGIKRLVDIANCPAVDSPNTLSDLDNTLPDGYTYLQIAVELHRKVEKSLSRKQPTLKDESALKAKQNEIMQLQKILKREGARGFLYHDSANDQQKQQFKDYINFFKTGAVSSDTGEIACDQNSSYGAEIPTT